MRAIQVTTLDGPAAVELNDVDEPTAEVGSVVIGTRRLRIKAGRGVEFERDREGNWSNIGRKCTATGLSGTRMPLNYAKWDQLEVRAPPPRRWCVSLTSFFLTVDRSYRMTLILKVIRTLTSALSYGQCGDPHRAVRSLIVPYRHRRWKQRDIHEKREARKHKIVSLKIEIDSNEILLNRLKTISESLAATDSPTKTFSSIVQVLKENPSPDAPPVNSLGQAPTITFDAMILSLLLQVSEAAKKSAQDDTSDDVIGKALIKGVNDHILKLGETTEGHRRELAAEEKERAKHITTEDIHEGFSSKVCAACFAIMSTF